MSVKGKSQVLMICKIGFESAGIIRIAIKRPAIKTIVTVKLETLLLLIARK